MPISEGKLMKPAPSSNDQEAAPAPRSPPARLAGGTSVLALPRADRILDARTRELASRSVVPGEAGREPSAPGLPVLVCAAGRERYGLALASIATVLPFRPCVATPGAPPALLGLFGRAGSLYQALDLAALLGRAPATEAGEADPGHLVVLRRGNPRTALRVERALGTASVVVADAAASAKPLLGDGPVFGYARAPAGALEAGETGFALIDVDRLLQAFAPRPPASGA